MLNQVVRNFVDKIPGNVAEMEQFLKVGDFAAIAKMAHLLKGTSGNLGLALLQEYCLNLEQESKSESANVESWILKIKEEVPLTLNEFNQIRK